jgi:putative FmdB family regulatory protein
MALFAYTCRKCDHSFEALIYNGEAAECPECKSAELERELSLPAQPPAHSSTLPMRCAPDLPPCGPGCCRVN